jgi:oxalate decarboxylase
MARFFQLAALLSTLSLVSVAVVASPVNDPQVRDFLAREDAAVRPLARRHASGYQTRHLRPEFEKRDGPDLGEMASFPGDPEPMRDGLGDTFLSTSNHVIDKQNIDNVAAPPTDTGQYS